MNNNPKVRAYTRNYKILKDKDLQYMISETKEMSSWSKLDELKKKIMSKLNY